MRPVEAVLVGAGQRGREAFGAFALRHPHLLKFVAVAEPDEGRRQAFAQAHGIPPERQFRSWEELFASPPLAPLCVNATMDREHLPSTVAALEAGYHLFLEKPMAHTPEGCAAIVHAARQHRRIVQVCHPMRYSAFYAKAKELLSGGKVGTPLVITMTENVAYWHFAHSFVRGNWRRFDESGPLILTKTCHDMDLAVWLADAVPQRISSIGELRYFRPENAPAGAPERCLEGCPAETSCPFYAPTVYLGQHLEWPVSVISLDTSLEARRRALERGPYGRCVFRCDNDVVDHQVVAVEFSNGAMLNFTVGACTTYCYRSLRVLGSAGELHGHFERNELRIERFVQGLWPEIPTETHKVAAGQGAHGGGDWAVMRNALRLIREEDYAEADRSLQIALDGHLLAFAAEEARRKGEVIEFASYASRWNQAGHSGRT
ncbi:MAG: Gfo/Idh/MocA family oxidoreductase [Candidatus Sumerlaeaceae bacterium]|nr:Gfo/Idh/MocA family oxidoreductase [Candidatus Sumerlaeaceae bacterium]